MNKRDDYAFEKMDIDPISKEILREMRKGEEIKKDPRSLDEKIESAQEVLKNTPDDCLKLKEGIEKYIDKLKKEEN